MIKNFILFLKTLCIFLLSTCIIIAQEQRPKVGLVLSGGGARGAAHVGVLKVLEENKIPVDVIAGTSFGAIVGGLYASGYTADQLEIILKNIDWEQTLSDTAPRNKKKFRRKREDDAFLIKFKVGFDDGTLKLPTGLITPNNLRLTLADLVSHTAHIDNFDDLSMPFRAVATDLENGEAVILDEGNLASAMVASMTVPALFPPVEHDGKLLVDGGIANNIPVSVAREMGADIFIVVDISENLLKKEQITSFANVLDQLTMLQSNAASSREIASLSDKDIFLKPDLSGIGFVDFENAINAVPRGKNAALERLNDLKQYAVSDQEWIEYNYSRNIDNEGIRTVKAITIENSTRASDEVIRRQLSQKIGEPLNISTLSSDLTKIYGIGIFDEVNYEVVNEEDGTVLNIITKEKEDGEDYVLFGLSLQENFEGETAFQMSAGFTDLSLNDYNGEWTAQFKIGDEVGLFAEIYQPLTYEEDFYVFANIGRNKINRNIGTDSISAAVLSRSQVTLASLQLGAGLNFDTWGTFRLGFGRSYGDVNGRIGATLNQDFNYDQTTLTASFLVDTLDNISFPKTGLNVEAFYNNNISFIGGDNRADSVQITSFAPFTWGKNTIGLRSQFYSAFSGIVDDANLYPLGGFMNLSAFYGGQLTGHHAGSLSMIYYRNIAGGARYLGETPLYIGGTIEAGNIWQQSADIGFDQLRWSSSVFVGADSIIGPIYLGGAIGSNGQSSIFLNIGQIF